MPTRKLALPFPPAVNPYESAVARHLGIRMRQMEVTHRGLVAEYRKARLERVIARMYPTAEPRELRTIADIVVWLVLIDDYLDPHRDESVSERIENVQAGIDAVLDDDAAAQPQHALGSWLGAVLQSLHGPTGEWRSRLTAHIRAYGASLCAEALAHDSGEMTSIEQYLARRQNTAAWPVLVDLLELQPGATIADELRASDLARTARTHAGEVFCAINDVLSLDRELVRGERHNLAVLIGHHHGCALPDAIQRVYSYITERTDAYLCSKATFLTHTADIDPQALSAAERYTAGLEHLIRGSHDWSIDTERYSRPAKPSS